MSFSLDFLKKEIYDSLKTGINIEVDFLAAVPPDVRKGCAFPVSFPSDFAAVPPNWRHSLREFGGNPVGEAEPSPHIGAAQPQKASLSDLLKLAATYKFCS